MQSVSAILDQVSFGMVLFPLPLIPDGLYHIHWGCFFQHQLIVGSLLILFLTLLLKT